MAESTPLTEQDIENLSDIMGAMSMLDQYGVPMEGVTNLDQAKARLRGKLSENSGGRVRKPGDAANIMKEVLQADKESRHELLHLCNAADTLLMTTVEHDVRQHLNIIFGDVADILKKCRDQLEKDDCPILVAGETSAGKSTLLNVLLGENILPATLLSTTSVICEIKYDKKKKAVIHLNEPDPQTGLTELTEYLTGPTEADLKKISQYIHTKGGARDASSTCNKVEIYWPLPLLEGGIFIVDSPGVGESSQMDEHVSEYISEAYAFMYVINSANAGGVQPGRLLKLLELSKRIGPKDLHLFDPKAAIFVCNKWDQVPDHEKEEVKRDTMRKLKQYWPSLDESQLFYLSAVKAQEAVGYVTDDLDRLLDGIDSLLPRSLRHKLTLQYSWIWTLVKEATKVVRAKLNNAMRSQDERETKAREVLTRLLNFKMFTDKYIQMLAEDLERKARDAVKRLRGHLQSDVTKAAIVRDTLKEAPSLTSTTDCDAVRGEITKLVLEHTEEAMRRWNASRQYFQKIEADLIKNFKDVFNLIEEKHNQEIEQALSAGLDPGPTASAQDTNVIIGDEEFGVLEKVILGVTAPIWIPVGIAVGVLAAIVGLPVIGLQAIKESIDKRAVDKKFMKTYNEDKSGYIKAITDRIVQELCETRQLEDFVNGCLERPIECLLKLKSAIPKIQEADKQMIDALANESRSQRVLRELYTPQFQDCNALQGKLALFNLKRLRQIEYNLDELLASMLQKIGSGGFGQVYKVQIKSQGTLKEAALKIAKEVITEDNVIEFHNEEECLRYLKDPHIVDYYGLAAAPHPESGGLRLGVLMECCPHTLLSWLNGHKERTPAWWPDDEGRMKEGFNTVKGLALQLCLGLKVVHEKRYMHRDLKLENVLVTEKGVVKIADMGLAKNLEEVTGTQAGTLLYAAPEVFHGRDKYDISADIYSLGFCLLEMWYGLSVTEDKEYLLKVFTSGTQRSVAPPTKLAIPNTAPPCSGWVSLMKGCWKDPKSRPPAGDCVQLMSKMKL
ncbi:MAP3K15 [Branchiostoma lanceolatum]|uniref:MAP3K15 protein n=1 Tax=Branchiostoma lanceolatum TaxID=7740 RepID=A0A8J9VDM4_BRALA|nr:MAP3K15 [Branchiostoma lanceolatum]